MAKHGIGGKWENSIRLVDLFHQQRRWLYFLEVVINKRGSGFGHQVVVKISIE